MFVLAATACFLGLAPVSHPVGWAVRTMGGPAYWVERLRHNDPAMRLHAVRELGGLGSAGESAVPALIQAMGTDDAALDEDAIALKSAAEEAIRRIGPRALPALIREMSDPASKRRSSLAQLIGTFGPQARSAVPSLIRNVRGSENNDIVITSVVALGRIGSEAAAAVPALTEVVKSCGGVIDRNGYVASFAIDALGNIGPDSKAAVPALTAVAKNAAKYGGGLRGSAAMALAMVDGANSLPVLTELLTDLDTRTRIGAACGMIRIGRKEKASPVFVECLKDAEYCRNTLWVVEELGADDPVAAELRQLVRSDHDIEVRLLAVRRLANADPKNAAEFLIEVLGKDASLRRQQQQWAFADAFRTLGASSAERTVPVLIKLLAHEDDDDGRCAVRYEACEVLGSLGPSAKAAVPALRARLDDHQELVRIAAADALRRIRSETIVDP